MITKSIPLKINVQVLDLFTLITCIRIIINNCNGYLHLHALDMESLQEHLLSVLKVIIMFD